MNINRRHFIAGTLGSLLLQSKTFANIQPANSKKIIVILLRGGLDSLATVAPTGDPDYKRHRKNSAYKTNDWLPLDSFFTLNKNLKESFKLFKNNELMIAHAVATPYRSRSHFDARDVLESGSLQNRGEGWLNKTIQQLNKINGWNKSGISIGHQIPLIMRGKAEVLNVAKDVYKTRDMGTLNTLIDLYSEEAPDLAELLLNGLEIEVKINSSMSKNDKNKFRKHKFEANSLAKLMATPGGPDVGCMELAGFDTHNNENPNNGSLARALSNLDETIITIKSGMGKQWENTTVVAISEFGRTIKWNGTNGTDHGTASCGFFAGGNIGKSQVIAKWPGLKDKNLYQKRDLLPTLDLFDINKIILENMLHIDKNSINKNIFS